jgi:hypothetical protein
MNVKIHKEIRGYEERLFLNLTIRQFICGLLGIGIGGASYFLMRKMNINDDIASWGVILASLPILAAGFFAINNMTLEKYIWAFIKTGFIYPVKRKYRVKNKMKQLIESEVENAKPV